MTSFERIHAAMRLEKPDRVPVMCQLSQGYMAINGGENPFDMYFNAQSSARAFLKTKEDLSFDGIILNVAFDEDWQDIYKNAKIEKTENFERYTLSDGRIYEIRNRQIALVHDPVKNSVVADIDEFDPDKMFIKTNYSNSMVLHKIIAQQGKLNHFSVHGEIVSPFDCLCVLMGLENAMMALVTDPEKCEAILDRYTEQCMAFAKAQIDVGVDTMKISSPFAGGSFISRDFYARFVMPFERAVVRKIHDYAPNMPVYTHTCGFIGDRLDLMVESEINGIECMDPPPLGNTELADAKAQIGSKIFLKGNMDSVNVLLTATEESIEEYVKEMIECGAPNGGYILSTACSVAPHVKPEIMKRLVPLAQKYGCY